MSFGLDDVDKFQKLLRISGNDGRYEWTAIFILGGEQGCSCDVNVFGQAFCFSTLFLYDLDSFDDDSPLALVEGTDCISEVRLSERDVFRAFFVGSSLGSWRK